MTIKQALIIADDHWVNSALVSCNDCKFALHKLAEVYKKSHKVYWKR